MSLAIFEQHILLYFIYGLRCKVYCTFPSSHGPAACGTIHQASFGLGYICAYQPLSNCQEDRRTGPCACCSNSKNTSFGEWFSCELCLCGTLARTSPLKHGKTMQDLSSRNTCCTIPFLDGSLWGILKWRPLALLLFHVCIFWARIRVAWRYVECIATRSCQVEEIFFRSPNLTRMVNARWWH